MAGLGFRLPGKLPSLFQPLFEEYLPGMEFERPPGPRLAPLEYRLGEHGEGFDAVHAPSELVDFRKLDRLLDAPEQLEFAVPPAKQPAVDAKIHTGPQFGSLLDKFRRRGEFFQPLRRHLGGLQPAIGPDLPFLETGIARRMPQPPFPRLGRADAILHDLFFGFVPAYPDAARGAIEYEDAERAGVFRVEQRRRRSAEIGDARFVPGAGNVCCFRPRRMRGGLPTGRQRPSPDWRRRRPRDRRKFARWRCARQGNHRTP